MKTAFYASTVGKILKWARTNSLWYISTGSGCCADESLNMLGCRYDVERFGSLPQVDPRQADLLIVCGVVTRKTAPHLRSLYDEMSFPKYVMSVGTCSMSGGPFGGRCGYSVLDGIGDLLPVDVYVPGCPPRPEAIMNGLIALQEKIGGIRKIERQN